MSSEIDQLRVDMNKQMDGVRNDIREVSTALTELIRIDGEQRQQDLLIDRIGRQVDEHENRLRSQEINGAGNQSRLSSNERIAWLILTSLVAAAFYYLRG